MQNTTENIDDKVPVTVHTETRAITALPVTVSVRQQEILSHLLSITRDCRDDMHEPDEQGLKVRVVGDHLDNACGPYVHADAIVKGYQEFVVCIERCTDTEGLTYETFNLADLIALARMARKSAEVTS